MAARSRRGFFGISCKTHFKVLWVLLLTLIYTVNDIMYQLLQILKEILEIIITNRHLPEDSYFKCDYVSRIMLNVSMPVIDFLMALSFLYFCFYQTDRPNLNLKFDQDEEESEQLASLNSLCRDDILLTGQLLISANSQINNVSLEE